MKKSLGGLLVAILMVVLSAPALANSPNGELLDVRVMSQNLYIGADLSSLLNGTATPAQVFDTVRATNYPDRAAEIARTIGTEQPDLVGLQEVTQINIFIGLNDPNPTVIDYLTILMGQLAVQGHDYAMSSIQTNAVTPPLPVGQTPNGEPILVQVVDRDAIIHNTETTTVANPSGQNFSTNFNFELGGIPVEFTRGFTGVDATVDGRTFRFVNTHLEVEDIPCGPIICQDAQAAELIDNLDAVALPVILVGDFNAVPGDTAYQIVKRGTQGGFADTWITENENEKAKGYTCCQAELLNNEFSLLDRRIDYIFVQRRAGLEKAVTKVLGDDRLDPPITPGFPEPSIPGGILWSSDHGAPFGRLLLEIGN